MTAYYYNSTRKRIKHQDDRKRVVVTGMGAVTPLGNTVQESWNNLISGRSGIGPISIFDASTYPVKIAAEVKNFNFTEKVPDCMKPFLGRSSRFCIQAAKEAIKNAGLFLEEGRDTAHVGISLGSDEETARPGEYDKLFDPKTVYELLEMRRELGFNNHPFPHLMTAKHLGRIWPFRKGAHMAANILSVLCNIQGPVRTSSSACASSGQAIGKAMRMIQDGDAEVMITGGCDSMIGEVTLAGFNKIKSLSKNNNDPEKSSRPFDLKRDGFVLGEGSGIIVLEELSHARKRGARILGEIVGYGSSSNAYRITASPEDGHGADICMRAALQDAGCSFEDIDYINAHGTSTYLNDKSETAAIKKVFKDRSYEIPISSNKSMMGHLIASAASIELIISILSLNEHIIAPTINYEYPDPECDLDYVPNTSRQKEINTILSNSFAFGGQNASILVKKYA